MHEQVEKELEVVVWEQVQALEQVQLAQPAVLELQAWVQEREQEETQELGIPEAKRVQEMQEMQEMRVMRVTLVNREKVLLVLHLASLLWTEICCPSRFGTTRNSYY